MKRLLLIVPLPFGIVSVACAGSAGRMDRSPDGASTAIEVDQFNPSIPLGACVPQCFEVRYSDSKVSVFLVTSAGKRSFVGAYTPDWIRSPGDRPSVGQWTRKVIVPTRPNESLKSGPGCGADGWGYALGATITTVTLPGGATVTGTYIGAGQQAVTTTYANGSGDSSIEASPMTEDAASSNTCEDMREAMAPPIE